MLREGIFPNKSSRALGNLSICLFSTVHKYANLGCIHSSKLSHSNRPQGRNFSNISLSLTTITRPNFFFLKCVYKNSSWLYRMSARAIKKNDKARDIFCGTFDWRNVTMPRKLKRTDFCFWDKSIAKDTYSVIVSVHFSNSAFIEVLKFTKWEFSLQSHIASLAHLVFFSHSSNLSWPPFRKGNTEHAMKFDNCALL